MSTNLIDWLNHFATDTWHRIEFCHRNERNYIFETTITQNLVFEFLKLESQGFPLHIEESTNERANGNDLEIIVQSQHGFIILPCQCKIVNKEGDYGTIFHKTRDKLQIDTLLEYGQKFHGLPIYLLYNYNNDDMVNQAIYRQSRLPVNLFGCSFTDASFIRHRYFSK
jgi:hypothetical protein